MPRKLHPAEIETKVHFGNDYQIFGRSPGGEKYQVLVATHLDRENHLHNHFVVNTVSFVDGIKY